MLRVQYLDLKAYLLRQNVDFISFSKMALVSWRIIASSIWFQILYVSSKYSPGHQRHLGEANITNI